MKTDIKTSHIICEIEFGKIGNLKRVEICGRFYVKSISRTLKVKKEPFLQTNPITKLYGLPSFMFGFHKNGTAYAKTENDFHNKVQFQRLRVLF